MSDFAIAANNLRFSFTNSPFIAGHMRELRILRIT